MKALKMVSVVLLVVVLIVGALLFYTLRNLDSLVQATIERVGSDVTQTEVTLNDVNIDLQDGRAQLSGLVVGNPSGYSSDHAFALNDIVVHIRPSSVGTGSEDIIVFEEIHVDGANVIAELEGLRNSNLQELMDNIQRHSPEDEQAEEPQEQPSTYSGPMFRVERFVFSNASMELLSEQLGNRRLDMPAINGENLGGDAGLPPQELAAALLDQVLAQAVQTLRSEVEGAARRELRDEIQERAQERLGEEDQERLRNLRDYLNR